MMRHDTQQHVTSPAEGIPGNLLPGRRSIAESTSSPKHQHAACLQHYKQTVKQHLGCIEKLFYTSDAQLVVDHHRSDFALVMSVLSCSAPCHSPALLVTLTLFCFTHTQLNHFLPFSRIYVIAEMLNTKSR